MVKVRRSGGRLTPDRTAVKREGGRGVLAFRVVAFFALMAFLLMYFLGAAWIDAFSFPLPVWLRWAGFTLGVVTVVFWTWTQVALDTQWSAQLQLTKDHHLIITGPYTRIRHPLYAGIFGWCAALSLLTANWIFVAVCVLSIGGLVWRVPKEE
jgi:protein-S-isoprenylcysteine O-methyltransferase Ste14